MTRPFLAIAFVWLFMGVASAEWEAPVAREPHQDLLPSLVPDWPDDQFWAQDRRERGLQRETVSPWRPSPPLTGTRHRIGDWEYSTWSNGMRCSTAIFQDLMYSTCY